MPDTPETELVVLGGGPGGYAAAFHAADKGMQVAILDASEKLGGSCLHVGCIPSKGLLHAAKLVQAVKRLRIPLRGTLGFEKAEVTSGGVSLDEVDSRTMESKLCPGLYLAGEVLDLDGPIGGYNFQAAWSTGWLAGSSVS